MPWKDLGVGLIAALVLRRTAMGTLVVFGFIGGMLVSSQVMNQTTHLIDASSSPVLALWLFAGFLPSATVVMLPVAFVVALTNTLVTMTEDSEAAVLLASGMHPARIVLPGFGLAAVMGAIVLAISLWVEPTMNRSIDETVNRLLSEAMTLLPTDNTLRELDRGLFLRTGPSGVDGRVSGVFLLDRRDLTSEKVYTAESAYFESAAGTQQFVMLNGVLKARDSAGADKLTINFRRFSVGLSFFYPHGSQSGGPLRTDNAQLWAQWWMGGDGSARAELARRASDWLYPLAFAAIAAWVFLYGAARTGAREGSYRWPMLFVVAMAAALRILSFALLGKASGSLAATLGVIGLPFAASGLSLIACWRLLGAGRPEWDR